MSIVKQPTPSRCLSTPNSLSHALAAALVVSCFMYTYIPFRREVYGRFITGLLLAQLRGWPSLPQHQPTPPYNYPAYPLLLGYQCRNGIYILRRSPSHHPTTPSTHLLLSVSVHQALSFPGMVLEAFASQAHSQGNAGSSYVGIRSHGNNGYLAAKGARLPQGSE
jgi:hypothetical protein